MLEADGIEKIGRALTLMHASNGLVLMAVGASHRWRKTHRGRSKHLQSFYADSGARTYASRSPEHLNIALGGVPQWAECNRSA